MSRVTSWRRGGGTSQTGWDFSGLRVKISPPPQFFLNPLPTLEQQSFIFFCHTKRIFLEFSFLFCISCRCSVSSAGLFHQCRMGSNICNLKKKIETLQSSNPHPSSLLLESSACLIWVTSISELIKAVVTFCPQHAWFISSVCMS